MIEINITNLAGVPSIVGLLALGLFVYQFGLGQSILRRPDARAAHPAGGDRRHARGDPLDPAGDPRGSYALGATQWQTVRYHILPYSRPAS